MDSPARGTTPLSKTLCAVGLGSNIEPRLRYLQQALARIDRLPGTRVLRASSIFTSPGWGRSDLDPFLNAVLLAETECTSPLDFLAQLRRIEDQLGRQRNVPWGPRTLDLDLLTFGDQRSATNELQLPHPWIAVRPFVYLPFRQLIGSESPWNPLLNPNPPDALALEGQTLRTDLGGPPWGAQRHERTAVFHSASEEQTTALFAAIAPYLLPGDLVALDGPMGAGKSVVARAIGHAIGIRGPIQSPTYTLCRRYEDGILPFEHWDLYRLGSPDDLQSTGYFPPDPSALRLVEWASLFPHDAGVPKLQITIEPTGDDSRLIRLTSPSGLPFPIQAQLP